MRLAALLAAALALGAAAASAQPIVVFAAASLKGALDEIAAGWGGGEAVVSYAGSPALARQIEQGAPADVFVSADAPWMDHLAERGLIRTETRRDLVGNRIVLVAHGPAEPLPALTADALAARLGDGRLAMADVAAVPAGRYGRAALETLGLWGAVKDRLAQAENVRAALALVARGEAPLGIVYATDAASEPGVAVLATFPASSHPPIVYPVAVTAGATHPAATDFVAHLGSDAARAVFARHGFAPLD